MKKRIWVPMVVLSMGAAVGAYGWMGMQRRRAAADEVVLPEFQPLPPGKRAPSGDGFGVKVGRTTLPEVEAFAKAHGLECRDTSARALMKDMRAKKAKEGPASALDGVAVALPALMRAEKLAKRAGRVGFDWPSAGPVLDKLQEEIGELEEAIAAPVKDQAHIAEELGDMLFVIANLARHADLEPEAALEGTNRKFMRRFAHIEARLAAVGRGFDGTSLEEMDALWDEAKGLEKAR